MQLAGGMVFADGGRVAVAQGNVEIEEEERGVEAQFDLALQEALGLDRLLQMQAQREGDASGGPDVDVGSVAE